MKSFIVFALFVAVAVAVPLSDPKDARILGQSAGYNAGDGQYNHSYESEDGKRAEEEGHLENVGTEIEGLVVRGSFSYTGPDGVVYTTTYTADKDGYHPSGAHIPV